MIIMVNVFMNDVDGVDDECPYIGILFFTNQGLQFNVVGYWISITENFQIKTYSFKLKKTIATINQYHS